jgi:hypothetical protein
MIDKHDLSLILLVMSFETSAQIMIALSTWRQSLVDLGFDYQKDATSPWHRFAQGATSDDA